MKQNSFLMFFLAHPMAANLLMILIILFGLYQAFSIEQEIFPNFQPPALIIEAQVLGQNAKTIEQSTALAIERVLTGEPGVERIETAIRDQSIRLVVVLARDADSQQMLGVVKARVDAIDSFPETLEQLLIYPRDDRNQLMWVHLYKTRESLSLYPAVFDIKRSLEQLPSVGKVELHGLANQELVIELKRDMIENRQLSLQAIGLQIRALSLQRGLGNVQGDKATQFLIHGEKVDVLAYKNLPITLDNAIYPVKLGDIATIAIRDEEPRSISRLNGYQAAGLAVYRNNGISPTQAAQDVYIWFETASDDLAEGLLLTSWLNESRELSSRLGLLAGNGIIGFILVLLILVLFTHWRVAIWVAAGLPVIYLGALALMGSSLMGMSINVVTLFGFLIVSGILVDDALVTGESIYTGLQNAPSNNSSDALAMAAGQGLQAISMPASYGVLTSIAAFFPLTLLGGDIGHAVAAIAWVIILCLAVSLIESKLILPSHIYRSFLMSTALPQDYKPPAEKYLLIVKACYLRHLNTVLRRPGLCLSVSIASFVIAAALLAGNWLKTEMVPSIADFELEAELSVPATATLSEQGQQVIAIEQAMAEANKALQSQYGLAYEPMANLYSFSAPPNKINLVAELVPSTDNPVSLYEFISVWRQYLGDLPAGYSLSLSASSDPDEGINVQFEGSDYLNLQEAAEELKSMLAAYPGVYDIRDNYEKNQRSLAISLSNEGAALGVDLQEVSQNLYYRLQGLEVQRVQLADQEMKVLLRYAKQDRQTVADVMTSQMPLSSGLSIPFDQLVDVQWDYSPTTIYRANGSRVVNVLANTDDTIIGAETVMDHLEDSYLETLIHRYADLTYRLEGEARESDEVSESLLIASILALFAVFALMALPLRSYLQAGLIVLMVPLALAGVIFIHTILGFNLSFTSLFGTIALIGILVNDSLVLIDRFNHVQADSLKERLIQTCSNRFRPIVLTSITTFFGVLPILLEKDPEAQWLVPIALSIGVGILFGTLITLLVLPACIMILSTSFLYRADNTEAPMLISGQESKL